MAKQQKITIAIPEGYSSVERDAISDRMIDNIIKRSKASNGVSDGKLYPFPKYSKSYEGSLDFKIAGKSDKVNLTLSGSMLNSIVKLTDRKGSVTLGFQADDPNNAKAEGNQLGSYGGSPNESKARRFLDLTKGELSKILKQFPLDDPESSMAMAIKLVAAREAAEEKAGDVFAGFEEME